MPATFVMRAAGLVLFAAILCLGEYWFRGKTQRLSAYGLIIGAGCAGGIYGFLNDLVSGTISPWYFYLFKHVPLDASLWVRAAEVGGPAGISGACVLGAIAAYVHYRRSPGMPLRAMLRGAWMPFAGAVSLSVLFPLLFRSFDPLGMSRLADHGLPPAALPALLTAWWEHLGVYAGSIAGFIAYLFRSRPNRAS